MVPFTLTVSTCQYMLVLILPSFCTASATYGITTEYILGIRIYFLFAATIYQSAILILEFLVLIQSSSLKVRGTIKFQKMTKIR